MKNDIVERKVGGQVNNDLVLQLQQLMVKQKKSTLHLYGT